MKIFSFSHNNPGITNVVVKITQYIKTLVDFFLIN